MSILAFILLASFITSCGSLVGAIVLILSQEKLSKILLFLISLSAGALMGGAFLHLLPEAANSTEPFTLNAIVLISFIFFFLVEKLLHWRHCHDGKCDIHGEFGYMNLMGDSIHNFIDGVILAAAFLTDIRLGVVTTIAVSLHEIPQEIGDFGVLLYSGFGKKKAFISNFLVSLTSVLGGVLGYYALSFSQNLVVYLLPIAAGGFIYIAASDLMPELRAEEDLKKSQYSFAIFMLGVGLMYALKFISPL